MKKKCVKECFIITHLFMITDSNLMPSTVKKKENPSTVT